MKKITSWNKILWTITLIIWCIVGIKWVSMNINATTGERIQHERE